MRVDSMPLMFSKLCLEFQSMHPGLNSLPRRSICIGGLSIYSTRIWLTVLLHTCLVCFVSMCTCIHAEIVRLAGFQCTCSKKNRRITRYRNDKCHGHCTRYNWPPFDIFESLLKLKDDRSFKSFLIDDLMLLMLKYRRSSKFANG